MVELRTYWKILMRRWWLVITPLLVVLAYTVLTYSSPPSSYQVVMQFSAGTEPAGLSVDYDRYYPWLASEYVANGLADVVKTTRFTEAVSARLADDGVDVQAGVIKSAVVTDNTQSIMVVYLTWPSVDRITDIGFAIAEELAQNGAAYYPQLEGLDPAVRLVDFPPPHPVAPSLRAQLLGPAVRLALAVVVGVGLAFVWHYLDPTVHDVNDVEELGISVVGQIPKE